MTPIMTMMAPEIRAGAVPTIADAAASARNLAALPGFLLREISDATQADIAPWRGYLVR
jgi:hypothetical protein